MDSIVPNWCSYVAQLGKDNARTTAMGGTVVVINGCFDVYHAGHAYLIEWAATRPWLANPFIVALVNSDESMRRLKGPGRPINPFQRRAYVLSCHKDVDLVVGFGEDDPTDFIESFEHVMVLVKGAEYMGQKVPGADIIYARGGVVCYAPLLTDISTTAIAQAIEKVW